MTGPSAVETGLLPAASMLADYGCPPLDEAVDDRGRLREPYEPVMAVLEALGADGVAARVRRMQELRGEQGIVFTATVDGRREEQVFPLDPVPRLIGAATWAHLEAGAVQRARALNAFLADVYGDASPQAAGAHVPAIVRDGIIPASLIDRVPGFRPAAARLAPGGQPRATVYGLDLLTDRDGRWVVLEDNLQVPSGLGYSLANRRTAAAAFPELHRDTAVQSPEVLGALLHRALAAAAPPRCQRPDPQVVVLSDGPGNSAWYEHRILAAEMGVPVVQPQMLCANGSGVGVRTADGVLGVDVVYRRLGSDELLGDDEVAVLLRTAAAAGTLTIANAPGNGVADDKAVYAFVGPMITYYLGEQPILADVGTWLLSEPGQYAAVRGRMGQLVVKPVDGSGGEGVMIGPTMNAAQVEALERQVEQAPHRFIAQEVIHFSTHPTVVGDALAPRHVDLRLFVLTGDDTVVVPAALTRVALAANGLLVNSSQGGGSKDTWLAPVS